MEATTTISIPDLIAISQGIVETNLGYLGVCLTIIIFSAGIFYFFNIRPVQKAVDRQEGDLESLNKDIQSKIDSVNQNFTDLSLSQSLEFNNTITKLTSEIEVLKKEAFEKIQLTEDKTVELIKRAENEQLKLRNDYEDSKLASLWNEHYMWEGRNVRENTIATLIEYMEHALEYKKMYLLSTWTTEFIDVLKETKENEATKFYRKNLDTRILVLMDKLDMKESDKTEIIKLVNEKLKIKKVA